MREHSCDSQLRSVMLLSSVLVYLSGQSRMQSRRLRIMREPSLDSQLHSAMMLTPCHLSVALYKFTALADGNTLHAHVGFSHVSSIRLVLQSSAP